MEKKYKLTEETMIHNGMILYRIESLKDFGAVRVGDKGGWIESEDNLSHEGNSWIGDEAKVYDFAKVLGDAQVYGNAEVFNLAYVYGEAKVFDEAKIYGNVEVLRRSIVCGSSEIAGN